MQRGIKIDETLSKKRSKTEWLFIGAMLVCIALFVVRICYTIDFYDEYFNTAIAYQTVLGQTFLSDIWNYFQMGDSIQIPFIWLYTAIVGSTDGIMLAGRFYYFVSCCLIGWLAYDTLRENRILALGVAAAIACYAPISLYYWWYDTTMLQFSLLGCLFLIRAQSAVSVKSTHWNLILAGLSHAYMVFAYPLTIAIVVALSIYLFVRKYSRKNVIWYIVGLAALFAVFAGYSLSIGIQNLFVFRMSSASGAGAISESLGGRSYLTEIGAFRARITASLKTIYRACKPLFYGFGISAALIALSFFAKKRALTLAVLLPQAIIPLICAWGKAEYATMYFACYFFLLAMICWVCLVATEQKGAANQIMNMLWLPSLLAFCAVSLTAVGGDGGKSILGFYLGAVCGVILYLRLIAWLMESLGIRRWQGLLALASLLIVVGEVTLFWQNTYRAAMPADCNYVIESGPAKGIRTQPDDAAAVEAEKTLRALIDDADETMLVLDRGAYLYMAVDLKIAATTPGEWDGISRYWDEVTGKPDIILCLPELLPEKSEQIRRMLKTEYNAIGSAGAFDVYQKLSAQ